MHATAHRFLVRLATFGAIIAVCGLEYSIAQRLCPNQGPFNTACLAVAAVCTAGPSCTSTIQQVTANGAFGCQLSPKNQCLPGNNTQFAPCYTQCNCMAVGLTCVPNPMTCQAFAKVINIAVACPPGS